MKRHRKKELENQRKAPMAVGPRVQRSWAPVLIAFVLGAGLTLGVVQVIRFAVGNPSTAVASSQPRTLGELLDLPPQQLAKMDIARMNLLCAKGMPGAENLDLERCLAVLDAWAKHVKAETDRHLYKFKLSPKDYNNSEGYYRVLTLVTVLQQDLKVQYNAARILNPDFRNAKDLFIHGMVGDGNGGTCTSMPTLYIAVGRRLGYPLKLVATKAHLFARWDDGKERFNIEATNQGLNCFEDSYYKSWPAQLTEAELQSGYLKSMTAAEELAAFMASRGNCLESNGRLHDAQVAYAQAHRLGPSLPHYWEALAVLMARERPAAAPMAAPRSATTEDLFSRRSPVDEVEAINRYNRWLLETQMRGPVAPSPHQPQGMGTQRH